MLREANDFWGRSLFLRIVLAGLLGLLCLGHTKLLAQSVVLTWSPSADPAVAGYKIYCGTISHDYTNVVEVGNVTNTTISGLTFGTTYYFAATTYDAAGNESPFSNEATFSVASSSAIALASPTGFPNPTINTIPNVVVNENAATQNVNLSGITVSGNPFDGVLAQMVAQSLKSAPTLKITVKSSNTKIIPTPVVNYTSPKSTATLAFKPAANAFGTATITVTLNNGLKTNNILNQAFTITVLPSPADYVKITRQPTNSLAVVGKNVSLSVAATGLATLKYQWQFNGATIPSATGTTLTLKNITMAQAGSYSVTVSNILGSTNSVAANVAVYPTAAALAAALAEETNGAAHLTVLPAAPATLTALSASNGRFSFEVSGTDHVNYVVQASADLVNWVSMQTNASPFTFTDTNADQFSQRFYRANEAP